MKVCCSTGNPYDLLTEAERLGGCSTDHCVGPVEEYLYDQMTYRADEVLAELKQLNEGEIN